MLTRVRYPVAEIASGNCVFAEYHGFAAFEWSLGTFPNTPADSVVHTLSLFAKTGGAGESFLYVGNKPFKGAEALGDHPDPTGLWQPYLDPTREYCFGVSADGYGEATLSTRSGQVCGSVAQKSTPGAGSDAAAETREDRPDARSPARERAPCSLQRRSCCSAFVAAPDSRGAIHRLGHAPVFNAVREADIGAPQFRAASSARRRRDTRAASTGMRALLIRIAMGLNRVMEVRAGSASTTATTNTS